MASTTGVGGVFLRARDPAALAQWYNDVLGLPGREGDYSVLRSTEGQTLVWSTFPADTDYFGSKDQAVMINYRVDDLDRLLAQLRDAGVPVDDRIEEHEYGKFGWAIDPEGNRFELWQPPAGQ